MKESDQNFPARKKDGSGPRRCIIWFIKAGRLEAPVERSGRGLGGWGDRDWGGEVGKARVWISGDDGL